MDWLGLTGLVVGIAALLVAIYGVRDVREQVRLLVTLERNRSYARILHSLVWRVVEPVGDSVVSVIG